MKLRCNPDLDHLVAPAVTEGGQARPGVVIDGWTFASEELDASDEPAGGLDPILPSAA